VSAPRRERLGRGLSALLGEYLGEDPTPGEVRALPVSAIVPNPLQPRREFAPHELAELSTSIEANGLLQPIVVRPDPGQADRFQLIAGERRFRAVSGLGWNSVPAVIRAVDDETLLVLALVENLQRSALSPLDEAEGYRVLSDSFGLGAAEVARAVGKDRSTVSNALRLLKLPASVRRLLEEGQLSAGHARALLSVSDPGQAADLARRAAAEGWSVREVEGRARGTRGATGARTTRRRGGAPRNPSLQLLQEELRAALSTRVRIRGGAASGTIEVPYTSEADLERLFALLTGREAHDVLG
jgi:ParB family transcriptional regulator, chromosome partitioning protein